MIQIEPTPTPEEAAAIAAALIAVTETVSTAPPDPVSRWSQPDLTGDRVATWGSWWR